MALTGGTGGSGISEVVEDTSPQLGGQLDVNGNAIGDGTRELVTFTEDGSAVNHVNIENEATGSGPIISAAGDDTNIDLNISAKGTGNIAIGNYTLDADQTVGAGQDNYVLTYDNTGGLISLEAAAAGGSTVEIGVVSNNYYAPTLWTTVSANNNIACVANTIFGFPAYVFNEETTWTRIGIEVVIASAASTEYRLGLYNDSNGKPGSLVTDFGTVAADSTGFKELTISETIAPGFYWLALATEDGSGNFRAYPNMTGNGCTGLEGSNATADFVHYYSASHTFGALPDPFPVGMTATTQNGNFKTAGIYLRKV
jgi:hypothetical protein